MPIGYSGVKLTRPKDTISAKHQAEKDCLVYRNLVPKRNRIGHRRLRYKTRDLGLKNCWRSRLGTNY
jgi:hypothetical protein